MGGETRRMATITNQVDSVIPPAAVGVQSKLYGGVIVTGGAAATVVIIRDGTTAGAPEVCRVQAGSNATVPALLSELALFQNGIFADVDGNTASASVIYG